METATERAASPTSSVRTEELLVGLDAMGLALSPQAELMATEEGDSGGGQ